MADQPASRSVTSKCFHPPDSKNMSLFLKASGRGHDMCFWCKFVHLRRRPPRTNSFLTHAAVHRRHVSTLSGTALGTTPKHAVQRDSWERQGGKREPLTNNCTPDNQPPLHYLSRAASLLVIILANQLKIDFVFLDISDALTPGVPHGDEEARGSCITGHAS